MRVKSLSAKGFRNLKPLKLDFEGGKTVFAFFGQNGQGKTNLLESIYMCALSKSFRTHSNQDIIGFGEEFCRIEVEVEADDEKKKLEVIVTKEPPQKALKVNGVKKNAADFIGILKAVFFSPDDLSLIAYEPKLRRRYMDVLLSQIDNRYLSDLMRYLEVIRQRNALLKKIREQSVREHELQFWDEKMADLGMRVMEKRLELIEELEKSVGIHYKTIARDKNKLEIQYLAGAEAKGKGELLEKIEKGHERDIASGATRIGPHRDDLQFFLGGHHMAFFASRGEWRSLVLALKFAEIDLIEKVAGEPPILLLDDVFSELDEARQKVLFEAMKGVQTFVTTTHKEFLEGVEVPLHIYKVEGGKVTG